MQVDKDVAALISTVPWYHSIDMGDGIVTPGHYDHRPYLHYYSIPENLSGKKVIDIGAASGFFSFECERRGAQVTATDLPTWFEHDFGPNYRPDHTVESGQTYLHEPFDIAKYILGSSVEKRHINIYDISPETVGMFDIAFCGSVLIHLTDPIKALWNIASVTNEKAIIATSIASNHADLALATLIGYERGDAWWLPTQACLELMAVCAGFVGVEWVSEFQLDYRDGSPGPYHGVMHAYKTSAGWGPRTVHRDALIAQQRQALAQSGAHVAAAEQAAQAREIERLQALVKDYESGRFMRFMRWLHAYRKRESRTT